MKRRLDAVSAAEATHVSRMGNIFPTSVLSHGLCDPNLSILNPGTHLDVHMFHYQLSTWHGDATFLQDLFYLQLQFRRSTCFHTFLHAKDDNGITVYKHLLHYMI
jgi:hypothetical protein